MLFSVIGFRFVISVTMCFIGVDANLAFETETSEKLIIRDPQACDAATQPLTVKIRNIGLIVSPGYGRLAFYPVNSSCSWTIIAPEGYQIWVTFNSFKLDLSCEAGLYFYDGPDARNPLIDRLCARNYRNFVSPGNALHIEFDGRSRARSPGFSFYFQEVNPLQKCDEDKGEMSCRHQRKCYNESHVRDGVEDCEDGTDEQYYPSDAVLPEFPACGVPYIEPDLDHFRIKGGRKARPGSWPWQVSFRLIQSEPEGHMCGGILVGRQWVLSAGHCFFLGPGASDFEDPSLWEAHLGRYNKVVRDQANEVIRYPQKIFVHPMFKVHRLLRQEDKIGFDIALVKLNAPVPIGHPFVSPVCLPSSPESLEGLPGYVTGWGDTLGTGFELVLKQAAVPFIPHDLCQQWFPQYTVDGTVFCAGYKEGGQDSCSGDSGGPLVKQNPQTLKWELVGIVANGGTLCGGRKQPGIYTNVSRLLGWIEKAQEASRQKEYNDIMHEINI